MPTLYEDQVLQCNDCPEQFVFTQGEQAFYAQNNFTPPKRCKECRAIRKKQKEERGYDKQERRR
jgi:hypothetical protein